VADVGLLEEVGVLLVIDLIVSGIAQTDSAAAVACAPAAGARAATPAPSV
jgi:hypothetical protein